MANSIQPMLNSLARFINTVPAMVMHILLAIIVFSFFWLLRNVFTEVILKLILKIFSKTHGHFIKKILSAFKKPLRFFFVFLGLYLALYCFPLQLEQQLLISKLFRSILIFLITWGLYNLSDVNSILFKKLQEKANIEVDKVLASFLSKFLKVILVLIAFTIIAQEWNYDINGLIAGLGLGGLALALAAKDSLANIFGGIVIILDKPFTLGDWVSTNSVEGTVEEIGFRSTKIRTFAQALVTVPNSTLANEAITNWSKRGKRRIDFELRVTYNTPKEKLAKCITRIEEMLKQHPDIHQETILVKFDNFGENGFHIFLYFFTITTVWGEFLQVKEDVNFKILQILEEEGVSVAFPSRDLYFQTALTTKSASLD
ncbi:MAG: mechanosensitive ion channel family protein [Clostridia bacterium]|nr:mechanosensitive ion channel family protein [Clostridia bacterium]